MKNVFAKLLNAISEVALTRRSVAKFHIQKLDSGLYGVFVDSTLITTHPERVNAESHCQRLCGEMKIGNVYLGSHQ